MKLPLILFLSIIAISSSAQEIVSNTVDGFTNERTVETSVVSLKQGFSTGFGASYTQYSGNYFLNIVGYGDNKTLVKEQDQIWLVLDDGSVVKLIQRADMVSNGSDNYQNIFVHHYLMKLDDVEVLKNLKTTMIRIVSATGNTDFTLSKKNSAKFQKLNDIFLREVSKE